MVIANPLEFNWAIGPGDRVSFYVKEPYNHRLVCFLRDFCEENKKTPSLTDWLEFYKKVGASQKMIKDKIKWFNKNKRNVNKSNVEFDKLYNKIPVAGKAKKVVKKRT